VAHVSDLHLGADQPAVVAGLRADLPEQRVGQVLVSGDLTQRARAAQFRRARELLDGFGLPWVSVPGNHDLPLDRVVTRQARPLHAYRRLIDPDPEPCRTLHGVLVLGLSTARRYYWKGGRIDRAQVDRIGTALAPYAALKVLMVHHPVFLSAQRPGERIVRGVDRALRAAAAAGVDVVLCGHDHVQAHVDLSLSRPYLGRHMLGIMAGTATSHRVRANECQSYNILDLNGDRLTLEVRQWQDGGFGPLSKTAWTRTSTGWIPAP
jgi:3',5'-cyclic AMP phosphodiesterase CpdA